MKMAEKQKIKFEEVTEKDLEKINYFSRKVYGANEVCVFNIVLCDNEIDKDYEQFTVETLETLSRLYLGKSGILDNSPTGKNQVARIYDCVVKKIEGKLNSVGEDFYKLIAKAFIPINENSQLLINKIKNGIITEVSVGCSVGERVCSICGKNINTCSHLIGHYYSYCRNCSELCYGKLIKPYEVYEWSFVAEPTKQTVTEETDCINIFNIPDLASLNTSIDVFENQHNSEPYLIMNLTTLRTFEELTCSENCFSINPNDINCNDYDNCTGCPYEKPSDNSVIIEHDCENQMFVANYFYKDNDYTILIDNKLTFGVVKIR